MPADMGGSPKLTPSVEDGLSPAPRGKMQEIYAAVGRLNHLSRCRSRLVENLDFVLEKLPTHPVDESLRREITEVCGSFRDLMTGVLVEVTESLEVHLGVRRTVPRLHDPEQALGILGSTVHHHIEALNRVIRRVQALPYDDRDAGAVMVLLNESGANILECHREIREDIEFLEAHWPPAPEKSHELVCSVCGERAALLELRTSPETGNRYIMVRGIVRGEELPVADGLFEWLANGELRRVAGAMPEGIDCYCPTCDLVYCRGHYRTEVEYDEGFYDCTRATCPRGHRRMIDD